VLDALRLLLVAEVLGVAALPLTRAVLGRLPGGGLAFAKPVGLLAAAYPVWLLASLHVVPYGLGAAIGGAVLVIGSGAWLWRRDGRGPVRGARGRRLLVGAEATFALSFGVAALLAAFSPDIRGTEKPMDMALLTSIQAGDHFPPHDPWLAGEQLDYYYFGQYLMAFATRLAGVEPVAGYNLALALLFALSMTAAYALGASLTVAAGGARPVLVGIGAALCVCVAGNLDAAQTFFSGGASLAGYDWFGPSRVIPDAITEFPAFAFVLGDLHAHLLAVPFTLLAFGFALQVVLRGPAWSDLAPAGVALGALYAINAWSYPVAAAVLVAAVLLSWRDPQHRISGQDAAGWAIGLLWASILAFLPFWLTFHPPTAGGLGLVEQRRSLGEFLRDQALILGAFLWVLGAAFVQRIRTLPRARVSRLAPVGVALGLGLLGVVDLAQAGLVGALIGLAAVAAVQRRQPAERFGWLLIATGLGCVLLPELVYVRDEFDGSDLFRMNMIFKVGFQAWILLALAAACLVPFGRRWLGAAGWRLWAPVALVGFALAAIYPVAGTYARKAGFRDGPRLDGLRWLQRDAPGDVAAIAWLRAHAAPGAVVLEAVGPDYSEFGHARISTFSGRAAVLGWAGHELQWGHDAGTREADVRRIYRTTDAAEARRLLDRYKVDYVVAGPLERADYGEDGLAKLDRLGTRVVDEAETIVWRV
jgi:YYY domain-containing protein